MDALKYFLNIDPVGEHLRSLKDKQEEKRGEDKRKKKANKYDQPTVAVQFQYIPS